MRSPNRHSIGEPCIFISYAREDEVWAARLFSALEAIGLSSWIDTRSLVAGQNWKHAIRTAIRQCRVFLAVISTRSLDKRGYVQRELNMALDILDEFPPDAIFLIPVRIDDCEPPHEKLRSLQWVDMFPDFDAGFDRVVNAMASIGLKPTRSSTGSADEECHEDLLNLVLKELRSKPDVNWTAQTVAASISRNRPAQAPGLEAVATCIRGLVQNSYLSQDESGRLVLEERAIEYLRSAEGDSGVIEL